MIFKWTNLLSLLLLLLSGCIPTPDNDPYKFPQEIRNEAEMISLICKLTLKVD